MPTTVEQLIMTELAELKKLVIAQSPNAQERERFNPSERKLLVEKATAIGLIVEDAGLASGPLPPDLDSGFCSVYVAKPNDGEKLMDLLIDLAAIATDQWKDG